jgi:hypothetical protein
LYLTWYLENLFRVQMNQKDLYYFFIKLLPPLLKVVRVVRMVRVIINLVPMLRRIRSPHPT